jgi:cell division protein YceG involved in septum cleavage
MFSSTQPRPPKSSAANNTQIEKRQPLKAITQSLRNKHVIPQQHVTIMQQEGINRTENNNMGFVQLNGLMFQFDD